MKIFFKFLRKFLIILRKTFEIFEKILNTFRKIFKNLQNIKNFNFFSKKYYNFSKVEKNWLILLFQLYFLSHFKPFFDCSLLVKDDKSSVNWIRFIFKSDIWTWIMFEPCGDFTKKFSNIHFYQWRFYNFKDLLVLKIYCV